MSNRKILRPIDWNLVREYIATTSPKSTVYVGVDSQQHGQYTHFGLAVVIHIESSKGGKMFVEISKAERMASMRERLMKEVELAVDGAFQVIDVIDKRGFVVHLDINPDPAHKSNSICKEAIGYVTGQGFECALKPYSWCASHAADHLIQ